MYGTTSYTYACLMGHKVLNYILSVCCELAVINGAVQREACMSYLHLRGSAITSTIAVEDK